MTAIYGSTELHGPKEPPICYIILALSSRFVYDNAGDLSASFIIWNHNIRWDLNRSKEDLIKSITFW